ncbi:DUF2189 domain-containing protein [Caenispirillum bisanense]|uniref:DUF2189 domain-containing protein n=1 Tax=Caenispirillum bisanense TaxID=414052 RepID=UPI0031E2237E
MSAIYSHPSLHRDRSDPHRVWLEGRPYPNIRSVTVDQSSLWLAAGWRDLVAHPGVSLAYGAAFTGLAYLIVVGLSQLGMASLILPLVGGFLLVAPVLAVGLYEASRRRETGEPVRLGMCWAAFRRNPVQLASMGLVLMILYMIWLMLALLIFAMFYNAAPPNMATFFVDILMAPQAPLFLLVGTLVGGALAAVAFTISVVALPMLLHRPDTSAVFAMAASVEAVRKNARVMIGWAAMIAVITFAGMATFFIGLIVMLPLAGHASWHAYRGMIGDDDAAT